MWEGTRGALSSCAATGSRAHTLPQMLALGKWQHWDLVIISSPFQTVIPTDFCLGQESGN